MTEVNESGRNSGKNLLSSVKGKPPNGRSLRLNIPLSSSPKNLKSSQVNTSLIKFGVLRNWTPKSPNGSEKR